MTRHLAIVIALFVIDRLAKLYILHNPSSDFLGGGFIDLYINTNLAFSLPIVGLIYYPVLAIIILILISYWLRSLQTKKITMWPWAMIIVGALSNVIDRISYGGVIDFINLGFFPVFNISDVYISIAVVWLLGTELIKAKATAQN